MSEDRPAAHANPGRLARLRRWPARALLGLLVYLPGAQAGGVFTPRLAGDLPASLTIPVGEFRLAWIREGGARLEVRHRDAPARLLWSSQPNRGFVSAARAEVRYLGARGFFRLQERFRTRTFSQGIEGIAREDGGARVWGRLSGGLGPPCGYSLQFQETAPGHLRFQLSLAAESPYRRVVLSGARDPDERFYGFGEQFSHLDLAGRRVPIVVQEQGIGRGLQPLTGLLNLCGDGAGGDWSSSYAPVPHTLTSAGRSLFLEGSEPAVFDLSRPETLQVEQLAPRMVGRLLFAETPLGLVERYTAYTGRMPALPDWFHEGAIVGMVGGPARVRALETKLRAAGVPIAAFFLQDWVGERETPFGTRLWWNWEADSGTYPDWPGFVRELRGRGARVLAYVNPFLADAAEKAGVQRNLYREAAARGYLVRDAAGAPYAIDQAGFTAGLVDLSHPQARAWLKQVIRDQVLATGVSGWMGDFGEALPFDAALHTGEAAGFHNRYPEAWQALQAEALAEAGLSDDVVFFSRSAFTRSPGVARCLWLGDQLTSWDEHDGLESAVTGLVTGGISGFALNHGDIGGYTTVKLGPFVGYERSRELFWRWMEWAAWTPVFRTHDGLLPGVGHQLDDDPETLAQFARCAQLFQALFPYRRALMVEAARTGAPLVRHPALHWPGEPRLLDARNLFLLGSEYLVAPVVRPGVTDVSVPLPPGRWVHLWSGRVHGPGGEGSQATIPAPLGQPAVLYREGSREGSRLREALRARGLLP